MCHVFCYNIQETKVSVSIQVGKNWQQCLQAEVLQHPLLEVGLLLLLLQQLLLLKRVSAQNFFAFLSVSIV
jgi:hypothetical protein